MEDSIAPEQHEDPVKWFELFYDLVIVAAVVTFSDAITARPTVANLAWVTSAFIVIWLVWFATTFRFNHDRRDEAIDRLIIVVQMIALSVCAIALGEGPGEARTLVAMSFGIIVLTLAAMTWRSGMLQLDCVKFFRVRTVVLLFAAMCVFASAIAPTAWYPWLWALAAGAYAGFWALHHVRPGWQVPQLDVHHLSERLGLLTIIVLGESFVKLAIIASEGEADNLDIEVGISMFICVFGIFWAYFDDVPKAGIAVEEGRRLALLVGHLIMQTGCIGLAIGLTYLAKDASSSASWRAATFAAVSVAVVYVGLGLLGLGTCRRPMGPLTALRLTTALAALGTVGAVAGIGGVDPNVVAYVLAAVILVHGAIAQQFVERTTEGVAQELPTEISVEPSS